MSMNITQLPRYVYRMFIRSQANNKDERKIRYFTSREKTRRNKRLFQNKGFNVQVERFEIKSSAQVVTNNL